MIRFTLPTLRQRRHLESGAFSLLGVQTKSKRSASGTAGERSFALYCFSALLYPAGCFCGGAVVIFRTASGVARYRAYRCAYTGGSRRCRPGAGLKRKRTPAKGVPFSFQGISHAFLKISFASPSRVRIRQLPLIQPFSDALL